MKSFLNQPMPTPVVQDPMTGRWYITMGRPGYNSPANNRDGYASEGAALDAHNRYAKPAKPSAQAMDRFIARNFSATRAARFLDGDEGGAL